MDSQDQKMTATCTGHEGHAVQLCHRCGWPFPNPHPSAKHRRAHKKVCGTIEGYKIVRSEEHDHHLAVSDDEDDEHTPNPKLVKKSGDGFGSSGGVGEKSNKSEDDVFSDAVTEFLDSGISLRLEGSFESVSGDKSMEPKRVEADDLRRSESLKVDETADTTEQVNEPTSNPGINNQSGSGEGVSVGLITSLGESEIPRDAAVNKLSEYDKLSLTLVSEEGRISDPALTAAERKEELCEKHVEFQDMYASKGLTSAEISSSFTKTVGEIVETLENITVSEVSFTDTQVRPKNSLAGAEIAGTSDANEGEKCDLDKNAESKGNFPVGTVGCGDNDQTIAKDVDHSKLSQTTNEMDKGASVEVEAIPCNNSTDTPSSCEGAADLQNSSSETELRNDGSHKPFLNNVTKSLHSVVGVEPEGMVTQLKKDNSEVVASTPEMQNCNDSTSLSTNSELLSKNYANENSYICEGAEVSCTPNHDCNDVVLRENSENTTTNETSPDIEDEGASKNVRILSRSDELVPSPSDVPNPHETCAINSVINVKDVSGVDSKSLQDEVDDKLTSNNIAAAAAMDPSTINTSSISDSLEGKCESISGISSQKHKTSTGEEVGVGPDTFEPPSFMTLVQSGSEGAVSEIETNQQQQKTDAPHAGWFPSLTNVSNESEGRKKNEEIIAKVTTWSPAKQHGPLKNLLNEAAKQVPAENQKDDGDGMTTNPVVAPKDTNKDIEQWNSPARYPTEIKKETKKKKKGKSYWVPFVCCSSVHRDL